MGHSNIQDKSMGKDAAEKSTSIKYDLYKVWYDLTPVIRTLKLSNAIFFEGYW
jgi:hypothetical protein